MNSECKELKASHFAKLILTLSVLTVITLFMVSNHAKVSLTDQSADQTEASHESVASRDEPLSKESRVEAKQGPDFL